MTDDLIRKSLGLLQDDADNAAAWEELRLAIGFDAATGQTAPPGDKDDVQSLLTSACRAHETRREYEAVAELLRYVLGLAAGDALLTVARELARVFEEELLDDARAAVVYARILELAPGDPAATDALQKADVRRKKWREMVTRYVEEAKQAADVSFKSALLASASETAYRYGRPEVGASKRKDASRRVNDLMNEVKGGLAEALELDPKNRRASQLLERIWREEGKWDEVAGVVAGVVAHLTAKDEKVGALLRLARVHKKKRRAIDRAMDAYEQVLDFCPGEPEATRELVDYFTEKEMWEHLVALYEEQLATGGVRPSEETGAVVQIAMTHWKMRGKPEAAEPYFERLRKAEPAYPGMLAFFREWCRARGETARLTQILTEAQRVLSDGPERQKISAELAQLAEEGANAQKAIEQWRNLLRHDPGNVEAREGLKRLYRATGGFNALADLLRGELERTPPDDPARLPLLKEIAQLYRDHIKSDSALVTVLSQMTAMDPKDQEAVRELVRVYDALGRWRDLLAAQGRLAELEEDTGRRVELYRAIARRWLEQFSNLQNAIEAYEKLHRLKADDAEAMKNLKELYGKRRAYRPLFDLLEEECEATPPGPARRDLLLEMAKLAAERLDRGADAIELYKAVLAHSPDDGATMDLLEKQAERDKDFATVAEVLERRAESASDDAAKLAVLHKLGGVYTDRLHDAASATRTWQRVLALSPGHPKALRVLRDTYLTTSDFDALTALYAGTGDWEGLVEVLSTAADKAVDPDVKVDLSYRAAGVYEGSLGAPERAARSYERVLAARPGDDRAAAALVPIYEKDEKWSRLPPLYEILLSATGDVDAKVELLKKLAVVAGERLGDKSGAFAYAARVFDISFRRDGALEDLEAAAKASGEWAGFSQILQKYAADPSLAQAQKTTLSVKLAEIAATQLGKVDHAVDTYKDLLARTPDDVGTIASLDRLLRATSRHDDLRWLFRHRVDRGEVAQKLEILAEWAVLEEESLGAPDRAASLYREIISIAPDNGRALLSLSRLLKTAGDAEGAAHVLERDRDLREGAERAAREIDLARLYMGPLKKTVEALAAATRALELLPNDPTVIAVVEELLPLSETRAKAASLLEQSYGETGKLDKQAEVLGVLIAAAASKADRLVLYRRLDRVREKLGNRSASFDVMTRCAEEMPQELEVWDRLGELATLTDRQQDHVDALARAVPARGPSNLPITVELDLAERAATLYEETIDDIDKARPYWERILLADATNERAFSRLKHILTTRERWEDLQDLYERMVLRTDDPPRQAELLTEAALIAEEITQDRKRAIAFYEKILVVSPGHEQATLALDKLYPKEAEWKKLGDLLARRIADGGISDLTDIKVRLARLQFAELAHPASALALAEDVLAGDAGNRDARDLAEKCLDRADLRGRAAQILEAVYQEQGDSRELVRVLEVRLELTLAPTEKREILRRIAELRDDKLTDDEGSFSAYSRLLPLAPDDAEARRRLLEIGRRLGASERAAAVLVEAAKAVEVASVRAEISSDLAHLYESLGNFDDAERAWKAVVEIDPDDVTQALPAARALERIYAMQSRTRELCDALALEVKLEQDGDARRELYGRLGQLAETELEDLPRAIAAWRVRIEDDPSDEAALAALDRLYERTGDHRAHVDVLRARERLTDDPEARRELMVRAAAVLAGPLADVPEAILAYRAILDDFTPERAVLGALAGLYERAERYPDLAETREAELALVDDVKERVGLLHGIGRVRQTHLSDPAGALEAFRQALMLDTSHLPTRAALQEMLADPDAQREAAEMLRPLYETDGADRELLGVLDIEVLFADTPAERLAIYGYATGIATDKVGDRARALGYAEKALKDAVGEPELGAWLERTEALVKDAPAGDAGRDRWQAFVKLLLEIAPAVVDEEMQLTVQLRTAALAERELSDKELAKSCYKKALDVRADSDVALRALERIYGELGEHVLLREILRQRSDAAATEEDKRAILFKEAELCEGALGDKAEALAIYEAILDVELVPAAAGAAERLYRDLARWDDLVALLERQLSHLERGQERERAELGFKLGDVYRLHLNSVEQAFDQYEAALAAEPQHGPTVEALEALMTDRASAARAAEMLEAVYLFRLDWRRVMGTLEARLGASEDPDEKRTLLRRLAKLHEEQEENYGAALEVTARLLSEDVTDETTWAELERLARVASAERRLAEIYAGELEKVTSDEPATARLGYRTGELFEAAGERDRALTFYRRAYAFAPEESRSAFLAIDRLLVQAKLPEERVALYRSGLDVQSDPAERLKILHTIGELQEKELSDLDGAIATHRESLDTDESDATSMEALTRLYADRERWSDLADLLRRRGEISALPEEEARFRLELGRQLETRLGDTPAALDEYKTVVDLEGKGPSRQGAIKALERLMKVDEFRARVVDILRPIYEAADDWRKVIEVNRERYAIAETTSDRVAILKETAGLLEQRGRDNQGALDCARTAFYLDPDDEEARESAVRLTEATGRWDDLAETYENAIARAEGVRQRELLEALARLHDKRRDDPRRALVAWARVFSLDETDPAPLEEMDQLATLLSDWGALVHILAKRAELLSADDERASMWRRIGEARRDMLDDPPGAIDACERALELEPDSAVTIDHLLPLYEARNDATRLVDLYKRRIELCGAGDDALKFELLCAAAARYDTGLGNRREAIVLYSEAILVKPESPDVVARLGVLYEAERLWPEMLENLRLRAATADTVDLRRQLTRRIADLLANELDEPSQALEAYRELLADGYDADVAVAVFRLAERCEEIRLEAAGILEPVLRQAARYVDLVPVLEMRCRAETDPAERAVTLRAIAEIQETKRDDAALALGALLRAHAEVPHEASLHEDLERVAGRLGQDGFRRYADALSDKAASVFDAQVTADLFRRLGRVARDELKDAKRAADAFQAAAERGGDTPEILRSLEAVYGDLGDTRALVDVLERRIALATSPGEEADLYHRLATLQIDPLGEKRQALATLRLALEKAPDHVASREALERLLAEDDLFDDVFETLEYTYRALGAGDALASLYERRVQRAVTVKDRVRARLDLARVLENNTQDATRAQRAVEAALLDDVADTDVLSELERLAGDTSGWASAQEALARALDEAEKRGPDSAGAVPRSTAAELYTRLAGWRKDKTSDARGAEEAFGRALSLDRENVEILRALEELQRAPGRERDLVATLRLRAGLENDIEEKKGLLREAKNLAESPVADASLAEAVLRDILREDDSDGWALVELTRLREAAADHAEVAALYLRRADLSQDGDELVRLRREAANVFETRLGDVPRAIQLYAEILDEEPKDTGAQERLRALYEAGGRFEELGRLLVKLVDAAESPAERSGLRLVLARIQAERFGSHRDAVDTLRAVLDEEPDHTEAALGLSRILEETGQSADLADFLAVRIDRAKGRGDVAAELSLRVRLGGVLETGVKDATRALETYESVLEGDANHHEALEAVARLAEARGAWEKAAHALARLAALAEGADTIRYALRLADAREKLDDDGGVEFALKLALSADARNASVRGRLRDLYEKGKKWSELAALLAEDSELCAGDDAKELPERVKLLRRAARIHLVERGVAGDAVPLLERAAELVPQDRELLLALCDAYTEASRERDATVVLERIIAAFGPKRTKELSVYHHRLGNALARLGERDQGLAQLDLAFKIDPGSIPVLRDLGLLALAAGDLERAQKTFRALLLQKLDKQAGITKGEVFFHLGEISLKQNDKTKAMQMLERAIENEATLTKAKELLASLKG